MEYKSEKEFLKNYDSSIFEKLSLTTDILVFSVSDEKTKNYRKLAKKHFSILLVKRKDYPFKNKWCLPGGFVGIDESIDEATVRVLAKEINLHNIYMEQLYTFSDVNRDPRMRIVSTAYIALVDKNKLKDKLKENASWFNILISENKKNINIKLDNGKENINLTFDSNVIDNNKQENIVKKDNKLAFDHEFVLATGIFRLRNKINYTSLVFNMMPKYFTITELQQVYESILGKKLLSPAFRRTIAEKVTSTGQFRTGGGHRPSLLFKFNKNDSF